MGAVNIRKCTVAEIEQAGALRDLLEQYGVESSSPEFGEVSPCFDLYRAMEAGGGLHILGAFAPGLVGFAAVIAYGLPHYAGRRVCAMESFFVDLDHRHTGAGLRLLAAAEDLARELGAVALMVSAPTQGRLEQVLPRRGYRHSSQVFVRGLV